MNKLFSVIKNIFSIEELRSRIFTTVGFLIIFRLGSFVVLPGIYPSKLQESASGIFGLLDTFLGGAFSNASIFALGIMPYISASIIIQLMTTASPHLAALKKEGESGRKKNNSIYKIWDSTVGLNSRSWNSYRLRGCYLFFRPSCNTSRSIF